MSKTIEEKLRDKFATGYDPVELKVSAKGINDENLEVTIEGQPYSVKGNTVSFLGAAESDAPAGESQGAGLVSGEPTGLTSGDAQSPNIENPEPSTPAPTDEISARLVAAADYFGASTYKPDGTQTIDDQEVANFNFLDSDDRVIFQGTLAQAEQAIADHKAKTAALDAQA